MPDTTKLKLIVGLGNPGSEYESTRHNAGFWFVDELARIHQGHFKHEAKFKADVCKINCKGEPVWLLKPMTFMNLSGQSAQSFAHFYKIPVEAMLVAHDELDLSPGTARLKKGGGHGGHNGLRDISQKMGKEFFRLRIGIGHPGHKDRVSGYVLHRASADDERAIEDSIDRAVPAVEMAVSGEHEKAMHRLHTRLG